MKNKRDCSLVVQLLKCNQSLDTKFVSQKVQTVSYNFWLLTSRVKGVYSAFFFNFSFLGIQEFLSVFQVFKLTQNNWFMVLFSSIS